MNQDSGRFIQLKTIVPRCSHFDSIFLNALERGLDTWINSVKVVEQFTLDRNTDHCFLRNAAEESRHDRDIASCRYNSLSLVSKANPKAENESRSSR